MLGNIVVFSPMNWQVFQRVSKEKGYIEFKGACKNVSEITVYITGKDYENNNVNITKTLKTDFMGRFSEKAEVPAGGWYKTVLEYTTDKGTHTYTADHVGVGEVIISAGQSNSTNCGQYRTEQSSSMVSSTDGIYWEYANDPVIGCHDTSMEGSIYPYLGDMLYNEFKVPIGFAPTGWGGTSTTEWLPDAPLKQEVGNKNNNINLFDYFEKRVLWLGEGGFRCVIWHQGESDEGEKQFDYYVRMCRIIETSRRQAGWYVPWFIAKATFCPWSGCNEEVRNAQEQIITENVAFRGPDTDKLLGDYRDYDGEGIHLSLKGLKKHAQLWAEALIPFIHKNID